MELGTIGNNIRKYRTENKLTQEQFAEMLDLSTAYIGMIERGEKLPALDTFINIANALNVSADMLMADVLNVGYTVKNSLLNEKLADLSPEDRKKIYDVIDILVK